MSSQPLIEYTTYAPPPRLAQVVECFWTFRAQAPATAAHQRLAPIASGEFVLHFGAPYVRVDGPSTCVEPRFGAFGARRRGVTIHPTGEVDLLAVRFAPTGMHRLLGVPLAELDAHGTDCAALFTERLRNELSALGDAAAGERLTLLISLLDRQLAASAIASDERLVRAVRGLERTDSPVKVGELARSLALSPRQLENHYKRWVGLSPTDYRAAWRIERAARALATNATASIAGIAHSLGYYDQPHFDHAFRARVGMSPRAYAARHLGAYFFAD